MKILTMMGTLTALAVPLSAQAQNTTAASRAHTEQARKASRPTAGKVKTNTAELRAVGKKATAKPATKPKNAAGR